MNDYFGTICDWEDEDDSWRPTVYLEVEDTIKLGSHEYQYRYIERDHWVLGNTKEENLAMGRCHEILVQDLQIVVQNATYQEAIHNVRQTHYLYLKRTKNTRG